MYEACIAPDNVCPLYVEPLNLCTTVFAGLPKERLPPDPEGKSQAVLAPYLDSMRIEPLRKAYVLLVREDDSLVACRTDAEGSVVVPEPGQAMQKEPSGPRLCFDSNRPLWFFWTYSPRVFEDVVDLATADLGAATNQYEFQWLNIPGAEDDWTLEQEAIEKASFECYQSPGWIIDDRDYQAQFRFIQRYFVRSLTSTPYSGLLYASDVYGFVPELPGRRPTCVIANSSVLSALYLGELIHYHALEYCIRAAPAFSVLAFADGIYDAAPDQLPDFLVQADSYKTKDGRLASPAFLKQYNFYARTCAKLAHDAPTEKAERIRNLYWRAVRVTYDDYSHWKEAAKRIQTEHGPPHPNFGSDRYAYLDENTAKFLYEYYELYWELRSDPVMVKYRAARQSIQASFVNLQQLLRQHMQTYLTLNAFHPTLEERLPDDAMLRLNLDGRYQDLAKAAEYFFWKDFDPSDSRLKRFMTWLSEFSGLPDKLGAFYSERYATLAKTQNAVARELLKNPESIETFLSVVSEYNERVGPGPNKARQMGAGLTVHATPEDTLKVQKAGEDIARLRFVRVSTTAGHTGPPGAAVSRPIANVRVAPGTPIVNFTPFPKVRRWPAWLETTGQALSLVSSLYDLVQSIKEEHGSDVKAFLNVTRDICQSIDSLHTAASATFPALRLETGFARTFAKLAEMTAVPGEVLEAALNVWEGAEIMYMAPDSPSALALARGDTVEAAIIQVKGVVLVASGTAPLALAGGGALAAAEVGATGIGAAEVAAAGAGTMTLGMLFFWSLLIGGFLVAIANLGIWIFGTSRSPWMNELRQRIQEAGINEWGEDLGPGTEQRLHLFVQRAPVWLGQR